jgi:hypothetical protein
MSKQEEIDVSQIPSEIKEAIIEERYYKEYFAYLDSMDWLRALQEAEKKPSVIAARAAYEKCLHSEAELIMAQDCKR